MPLPPYEYRFDFSDGLGDWSSWMRPSVIDPLPGSTDPGYVRLQAPGALDPNHIDGIGSLSLIAHLSTRGTAFPGFLDLRDAQIDLVVRGHDFDPRGAKLVFWICSTLPDGSTSYDYPIGAQITNWANTGNDIAGAITDRWQTITVTLDDDPADWTEAGNYRSIQGDWGARYQPLDLATALAKVDATLHLVAISDTPNDRPTGFIDLASITIRTHQPAMSNGRAPPDAEGRGEEDGVATGSVAQPGDAADGATYALVDGSARHGTVTLDPLTGAFTFVPEADFFGPDALTGAATFQYVRIVDGAAGPALNALVRITPRNDAPDAAAERETLTIARDTPFAFTLMRGHDIDGDRLTFRVVDGSVTNGSLALDATTGRYTFKPDPGYVGAAGFAYVVTDGQLDSAPVTTTFAVVPEAPALPSFGEIVDTYLPGDIAGFVHHAIRLAIAGDSDAAYHYAGWLATGTYVAQDSTSAAAFYRQGLAAAPDAALQLAQLLIAGDGVMRDYGEARTLLAQIDGDARGIFRLAMLDDLGLGGPQDHVRAVAGFVAAAETGHAEAMATLARRYLSGEGVAASAEDSYFWMKAALVAPGNGFSDGFLEVLRYDLGRAAASLPATRIAELDAAALAWQPGDAAPVNDAPVTAAADEAAGGPMGTTIMGTLPAGSDPDGERPFFVLLDDAAANGTIMLDTVTGDFTYAPAAGFFGEAHFTYALHDGTAFSEPKRVTLTVSRATTALPDDARIAEEGRIVRDAATGVLGNDVSGDASALRVVAIDGVAATVGVDIATAHGTLRVESDGRYTFHADRAAALTQEEYAVDTITYTIENALGERATATLSIRIDGVAGTVIVGDGVLFGTPWDDRIEGGTGSDYLIGAAGDDRLIGGIGAPDTLQGGTGNDTYVVSSDGDSIVEFADGGIDTIETPLAAMVLRPHVENLTGTSAAGQTLTGNDLANVIAGADGDDIIDGGIGDDVLVGGAGDDLLAGAAGQDSADYADAPASATIDLARGRTSDGRGGTDTLVGIENVIGTPFDDTIAGDAGANRLDGGEGRDYLIGGGGHDVLIGGTGAANQLQGGRGNDTYVVAVAQDTLVEFAGEGIDTVDTALGRYVLREHLENLTGTAATGQALTGNDADNIISGASGNDVLDGAHGDDRLIGGAGDDRLSGGAGSNLIEGGDGRDTADYADARSGVLVNLATGIASNGMAGIDTLRFVEDVRGSAHDDVIIGDAGANRLEGGLGRDYLIGGTGDDTLDGGSGAANQLQGGHGDDTYLVTATGDTVIEFAGEGVDTVRTAIARHELREQVENLVGLSATGQTLVGNAGDNVVHGHIGNDVIDGGAGADTLTGGAGRDRFVFNDAPVAGTIDTIVDFAPGEDRLVLSAASFGGRAGQTLPGAAFTIGAAARDVTDRIVYDPATGTLSFDPDGSGSRAGIVFAQLAPGLNLTATDIVFG